MRPSHVAVVAQVRGAPRPIPRPPPPPPPPPPVTPPILCDVCCEHVPPALLRGCAACTHRYCAPCVDKYWTSAIYSGNHARLLCMYGGCGVFATDADIVAVVKERTFRKMLYFRSRDRYSPYPDARWCATDMCWEFLGIVASAAPDRSVVQCTRCRAHNCVKCDKLVPSLDPNVPSATHVCATRKPNKAHAALFSLWATVHTKACPACAARIQRNHGCSHMTCTRCSSYFCWRCKGFLNNGCPLPGRACVCDRVMTAAAYSGLAVAGVLGSPIIIAAALVGGGPYVAYRVFKARREKLRNRRPPEDGGGIHGRGRIPRGPGRVLQPNEMVTQEDDEFDSGSETRLTAFSEVMVAEARGMVRPPRRVRVGGGSAVLEGVQVMVIEEKEGEETDADDPFIGEDGSESTSEDGDDRASCKPDRPFVLERRRGSVGGSRVARRVVL
ncbi:unnamed protein product [Chondrus crispus]|uniref:RING-type domain-containing protein n=1 Tax=Chondrus crispus TaxID=2769 RepID=R7QK57_CHOCR|nr:unnamed protein product [Chondrus crispus]CDF37790.1 unnamed protein product [Chondrus crispus]|eukprot:XP_005717661.1 unnamed protein product [Chondrus crispus]